MSKLRGQISIFDMIEPERSWEEEMLIKHLKLYINRGTRGNPVHRMLMEALGNYPYNREEIAKILYHKVHGDGGGHSQDNGFVWYDGKGIEIRQFGGGYHVKRYSWVQVTKKVIEMFERGEIELITSSHDVLTAKDVRSLDTGTRIILHGHDRHGYRTELHCTLVQSWKTKLLAYRDENQTRQTKPIRDYPGKYYTVGGDGCLIG